MTALAKPLILILLTLALVACNSAPKESDIINPNTKPRPEENVYSEDSAMSFGQYVKLKYDDQNIDLMLVAYKHEKRLDVLVKHKDSDTYDPFWEHPILATSGKLGPKRKEGDRQVPEGVYYIDRFNPDSEFHLSLGLNYPNESDKILGNPDEPGSDIFIHGNAVSIGCLAMGDKQIEQIYYLAKLARNKGQSKIPVLIFPFEMTPENMEMFGKEFPQHKSFWESLLPAYQSVKDLTEPKSEVKPDGRYTFSQD